MEQFIYQRTHEYQNKSKYHLTWLLSRQFDLPSKSFHGHIACCWLLSSPGYKLQTATVTDLRQGVYMLCQCRVFACFSHSMSFIGNKFKALMVKMGTSVLTRGVFDYSLRAYLFMYTRCIPITHHFYFLQLHLLCRVNIFHQHKSKIYSGNYVRGPCIAAFYWDRKLNNLTHLHLDKMAVISQTIFSQAFSRLKSCAF